MKSANNSRICFFTLFIIILCYLLCLSLSLTLLIISLLATVYYPCYYVCCFNYGNEKNVVRAATTLRYRTYVYLGVCVYVCFVFWLFYVCARAHTHTHNMFIENGVLRCDPGRASSLFASIKYFRNRANI